MTNLKTPLRYPGGKSRATKFLFADGRLPDEVSEYREPFLGGGSCALAFTKLNPGTPVWVNDKYENLYKFWKVLQERHVDLTNTLISLKLACYDNIELHRSLFNACKEDINSEGIDDFGVAWRFFILNKCSFSGLGESSGFSSQAWKQNFSMNNIGKLNGYGELIKDWKITNHDYTDLLKDTNKGTFVFLDPPYDINSFLYGKKGNMHNDFDHTKFLMNANNIKNKANMMITYNSNDVLKEMYDGYNQLEWDLTYTMHSGKTYREDENNRKELLITNYNNVNVLDKFLEAV